MAETHETTLRLRLFGRWEAQRDGAPLPALRDRRGDEALALLVTRHGRMVPARELAEALWPEEARAGNIEAAERSLRQCLSTLRHNLGVDGARLVSGHQAYAFNAAGADIDLVAADRAAEAVLTAPLEADCRDLAAGLHWADGRELLEGWPQPWAREARTAWRERYARALERLAERAARQGLTAERAGYLERLVQARPQSEAGWQSVLEALLENGERTRAAAAARRCRSCYAMMRLPLPARTRKLVEAAEAAEAGGSPSGTVEDAEPLEAVGGAMPVDSRFYVERPADGQLLAAIARRDATVLIKGPRQIGKTSLLARGLRQARRAGARVLLTDLQKLSTEDLRSEDRLYRAWSRSLADQLGVPPPTPGEWDEEYPAGMRFERFLRRLLADAGGPLVWGLDEVDRLFGCTFRGSVFSLLRAWHNERALDPDGPFPRLTSVLAYATEPRLFITDLNQSPFNVGTRLELQDFTREQAAELNRRHGSPLPEPEGVDRLYDLVGGHPYLLRLALMRTVESGARIEEVEAEALSGGGVFAEHLARIWAALARDDTGLVAELDRALREGRCSYDAFVRLRAAGVLAGDSEVAVRPRCRLYAEYLRRRLT
jgi:DNA-binding SARP family transcriptional activator